MLLEPLQPEVNHGRYKKSNHLRENQAANNDKTERTARRGVVAEPECKRHRAHESGESGHHDGPKAFETGFVNCLSQTQPLIDSFQREIAHPDSGLLHAAEQTEATAGRRLKLMVTLVN